MKTEINCDYIPSAALPSMLHNALTYLDSASYKGSEDGDDIYYLEDDNYIVFVSEYGNIRTFFEPDDGIAYYYRQ